MPAQTGRNQVTDDDRLDPADARRWAPRTAASSPTSSTPSPPAGRRGWAPPRPAPSLSVILAMYESARRPAGPVDA